VKKTLRRIGRELIDGQGGAVIARGSDAKLLTRSEVMISTQEKTLQ
jgi:hypothetical protein